MRNLTKRIFSVVLLLMMTTIAMAQKIQGYVVDQQYTDSDSRGIQTSKGENLGENT